MDPYHSPDGDGGPDRKRRRKVLSCMDCRRRKVQCDRALPVCGRCEKAGKLCSYEDDSSPQQVSSGQNLPFVSRPQSVTISKDVWDDMMARLLQQERIIGQLQAGSHISPATPATVSIATPHTHGASETPGASNDFAKEAILFRGKGFKSFYYGPTDARSAMTLIPDTHNFFREEVGRNPELVHYRREVEKLRAVKKMLHEPSPLQENLFTYLPERTKVDLLIRIYLEHIDPIHPLLHFPSFHREYEEMWQDPLHARPVFVAVVLLLIASCQSLVKDQPQIFTADSSFARESAAALIDACEAWFESASKKHTSLAWFQAQCLLQIAKKAHSIKVKRRWVESGNLFRLAVAAGMHRNPDLLLKKASVFEREMRRRIWSFVVEWDLQMSTDRGMPAVSLDIASDCGPPTNLHDTDFDETTIILPSARPLTELTKMTSMVMSIQSRLLRKKIVTMMNQPLQQVSYDEVLACTQELELNMASLPGWSGHERAELEAYDQSIAHLHIQLEQYLMILHARAARQAVSKTHATFSKQTFRSAARSVIDKLADLSVRGSKFLLMERVDVPMIFTSMSTLGNIHDKDLPIQELRNMIRPSLELADKILDLFEEKILTSGGLQWTHTFAYYDILLRKIHSLGRNMHSRPGIERIYKICRKILDNQDPEFVTKAGPLKDSIPTPKKKRALKDSYTASADNGDNGPSTKLPDNNVLPSLGFTEMLDWNFDDWMLYTDIFWSPEAMSLPPLSEQGL